MEYLDDVLRSKILFKFTENTYLIHLTIENLLKLNAINWKHNRKPDETRIEDIKNHILDPRKILNSLFHFHYDKKLNIFEILDGIHRYTAIKEIDYVINPSILEKPILIMLYINCSKGELIDIFENINKSISVPEMYTSKDIGEKEKNIVEEVVFKWTTKYKSHFSPSQNFRSPQINRETFTNLVRGIQEIMGLKEETELLVVLDTLNNFVRDYSEGQLIEKKKLAKKWSEKQIEKCKETKCYLFLYKSDIILDIILNYVYPTLNYNEPLTFEKI